MEATKKKRRDVDDFIADVKAKQERKSWRDVIAVHPAADLFPMMSESELRELGEDIKKNGMRIPITFLGLGGDVAALLDGRNRLDAMELAGIDIFTDDKFSKQVRWNIWLPEKQIDPYDYVLSANVHRRHLTTQQKRELVAKVIKAKPELSDRADCD